MNSALASLQEAVGNFDDALRHYYTVVVLKPEMKEAIQVCPHE